MSNPNPIRKSPRTSSKMTSTISSPNKTLIRAALTKNVSSETIIPNTSTISPNTPAMEIGTNYYYVDVFLEISCLNIFLFFSLLT